MPQYSGLQIKDGSRVKNGSSSGSVAGHSRKREPADPAVDDRRHCNMVVLRYRLDFTRLLVSGILWDKVQGVLLSLCFTVIPGKTNYETNSTFHLKLLQFCIETIYNTNCSIDEVVGLA